MKKGKWAAQIPSKRMDRAEECPAFGCRKIGYRSRKDARRSAARQPQHGRMSAYRCPGLPEGAFYPWHIGHLTEG